MTRSDPTGRAFKDALVDVHASVPGAAHAITVHVEHLKRRIAKLELDRAGLTTRVDELAAVKTGPSNDNPDLLIVTNDQEPISMTSPHDIALAALDLVGRLVAPGADPGPLLVAESIKQGPAAAAVFQIALQGIAEGARAARGGLS